MSEVKEYCLTESFEASCRDNEVVIMGMARFGRMELGRCVQKNYGNIGCQADVRPLLDGKCSGRTHCRFTVEDPSVGLLGTRPCPQDLSPFLQAAFRCERVATCTVSQCDGPILLSNRSGTLSSAMASMHGCGTQTCPWVIQGHPGQRINITLMDFSRGHRNTSHNVRHKPDISMYCREYAIITETLVPRTTTICGGDNREKVVYVSSSHRLEITFISRKTGRSGEHFLLVYQATGCPDLPTPPNAWIQRSEDRVKVICNQTKDYWSLTCIGTDWVGESRNCSFGKLKNDEWSVEGMDGGIGLPSVGVSVLIIFGVALVVVIYIAISIMCVLYFRRHRRRSQQNSVTGATAIQDSYRPGRPNMDNYEERTPMLLKHNKLFRKADGDYTDICELQLLNSSLDAKAALLKCHQRARSMSVDPGVNLVAVPECCSNAAAGSFRTFKPAPMPQQIYECSQPKVATLGRSSLGSLHGLPHARYHELDASRLHNCHNLTQDNTGVNPPDLQRDIPPEVVTEGLDNETNSLKEQQ